MVCDPLTDDVIRWTPEGNSFLITSCDKLEHTVFSRYFTSKKFSSFVRQLNLYGFHKTGPPEHWEFYHEHFLRGQPTLLQNIKRKKSQTGPDGKKTAKASIDIKEDIATLKRERGMLQEEVELLQKGQRALEFQLSVVLNENADMLKDIAQARQEQHAMQGNVEQILSLLSAMSGEPPAKRPRYEKPMTSVHLKVPPKDDHHDWSMKIAEPPSSVGSIDYLDAAVDAALRSPSSSWDVDTFITNLLRV